MNKVATELEESYLLSRFQVTCGLGDLKECDGTHSERSARRVPTLRNQRKHRTDNKHISRTSVGFRWLLDYSQVDYWLGDHFATTVAYLWASCALSIAVVCQMFMPLYIIVVLNLRRFSVFAPKIGDFERKIGTNDLRKWLYYNHFRMGVFFLKKLFVCRRLCRM